MGNIKCSACNIVFHSQRIFQGGCNPFNLRVGAQSSGLSLFYTTGKMRKCSNGTRDFKKSALLKYVHVDNGSRTGSKTSLLICYWFSLIMDVLKCYLDESSVKHYGSLSRRFGYKIYNKATITDQLASFLSKTLSSQVGKRKFLIRINELEIYTCIYIHTYLYVCMYVYMYVCRFIYIFTANYLVSGGELSTKASSTEM